MRQQALVVGLVVALIFTWTGFATQAAFPVTVTDDRGRQITIAAEPSGSLQSGRSMRRS